MKSINQPKKVLLVFADSSVRKGLADADLLQEVLQAASLRQDAKLEFYVTYARSLSYLVSNHTSRIYDHRNKHDLKEYDFVYFRKAGAVMQQMLSCAVYLRMHGIPFFDSEIGFVTSRNKLSQMFLLHEQGLPVPTTLFCRNRKRLVRLLTKDYHDHFTWPVIAKATGGTRGDANYLVKSPEELAELVGDVRRHFLVQSFIPNDGDYRALVVANKLRGLIKRVGEEGSHLNNTSKNGSAQWLPVDTFDSALQLLAVQAAQVCRRDVAGVDVLVDQETGQPYILEVNRAPQIENASFPDEKADILVEGIMVALRNHEPVATHETKGIGRLERVTIKEFPALGAIIAKTDTGAYSNTLHCSYIEEITDESGHKQLKFSPFDDKREFVETDAYFVKRVISSNGISENRYVVELHIGLGDQTLIGQVSLTDRSNMRYPLLLGRKFLKQHKLLVDVAKRFSV